MVPTTQAELTEYLMSPEEVRQYLGLGRTYTYLQVANQDELAEHIKAWGWTLRDARESGGRLLAPGATELEVNADVDVEVVYIKPKRGQRSPAWKDAQHVFETLKARQVPIEKAGEVGKKAYELLTTSDR